MSINKYHFISECPKHCSLCYNETECYECTQGFYMDENGECKRKLASLYVCTWYTCICKFVSCFNITTVLIYYYGRLNFNILNQASAFLSNMQFGHYV